MRDLCLQLVADLFLGALGGDADLDLFRTARLLLLLCLRKLLRRLVLRGRHEFDDGVLDGLEGPAAGHAPDGDGEGAARCAREGEPPGEGTEPLFGEEEDGTRAVVARLDEGEDGGQDPEDLFERRGELLLVRVRARVWLSVVPESARQAGWALGRADGLDCSRSWTALSSLRRRRAHLLNSSWALVAASSALSLRMSAFCCFWALDAGAKGV